MSGISTSSEIRKNICRETSFRIDWKNIFITHVINIFNSIVIHNPAFSSYSRTMSANRQPSDPSEPRERPVRPVNICPLLQDSAYGTDNLAVDSADWVCLP